MTNISANTTHCSIFYSRVIRAESGGNNSSRHWDKITLNSTQLNLNSVQLSLNSTQASLISAPFRHFVISPFRVLNTRNFTHCFIESLVCGK